MKLLAKLVALQRNSRTTTTALIRDVAILVIGFVFSIIATSFASISIGYIVIFMTIVLLIVLALLGLEDHSYSKSICESLTKLSNFSSSLTYMKMEKELLIKSSGEDVDKKDSVKTDSLCTYLIRNNLSETYTTFDFEIRTNVNDNLDSNVKIEIDDKESLQKRKLNDKDVVCKEIKLVSGMPVDLMNVTHEYHAPIVVNVSPEESKKLCLIYDSTKIFPNLFNEGESIGLKIKEETKYMSLTVELDKKVGRNYRIVPNIIKTNAGTFYYYIQDYNKKIMLDYAEELKKINQKPKFNSNGTKVSWIVFDPRITNTYHLCFKLILRKDVHTVSFSVDNKPIDAPLLVHEGEKYNLPKAPTKDKYEFVGWKFGDDIFDAGSHCKMEEKDVEYIAQWKPIEEISQIAT